MECGCRGALKALITTSRWGQGLGWLEQPPSLTTPFPFHWVSLNCLHLWGASSAMGSPFPAAFPLVSALMIPQPWETRVGDLDPDFGHPAPRLCAPEGSNNMYPCTLLFGQPFLSRLPNPCSFPPLHPKTVSLQQYDSNAGVDRYLLSPSHGGWF